MKIIHDQESFARMIAAQAHLRARLLAHRRAFPHPLRLFACRPPSPAEEADEADAEMLWLESAQERTARTEAVSAPGRANDHPGAGRAEQPAALRRCA